MKVTRWSINSLLLLAVLPAWSVPPAEASDRKFTLVRAIPEDVLLMVAGRANPERAFLNDYWNDVFEALRETGIGHDVMALIASLTDEAGVQEARRLRDRASELIKAVDWAGFCGGEMVFAERLAAPTVAMDGVYMGPPDMVWLLRRQGRDVTGDYDSLVAILSAIVEEVNRAAGAEVLILRREMRHGTTLSRVNFGGALPGAPPMALTVGHREDIILLGFGEYLWQDVVGLLSGHSTLRPLADDPRFRTAFAQLPEAEDSLTFFDMQAMTRPFRRLADMVVAALGSSKDVYRNTDLSDAPEARKYHLLGLAAYQQRDYQGALDYTRKAHEIAPGNSLIMYNLACFSALTDRRDEALSWLLRAVEAGFHAPRKIAVDSDLDSLRDDSRYRQALDYAEKQAAAGRVGDIIINSSTEGEAYKLCRHAWQVCASANYEYALQLVEQAYELAPKDSRVLYYLACFHSRLGHHERALQYLEQAVDGGFFCPEHIAGDEDLEGLRGTERYVVALERARTEAARRGAVQIAEKVALATGIANRLIDGLGTLDYVAGVERTEGHSVHFDTIAALVPDAAQRPIYQVFAGREMQGDFGRYLPVETQSFHVSSGVDLAALYTYLEDTLREAGPTGQDLLGKWAELQQRIGLDVRRDVFAWIEGQTVSVTLDNGAWAFLLKVRDEQTARSNVSSGLDFLSEHLMQAAIEMPLLAMLSLRRAPLQHQALKDFENLYVAFSPQPMVWGVADGHLILGSSAEVIALCLKTARGEHPNIRENPRVMAEALIPEGAFTGVSLTDQRQLGANLAAMIGALSMGGTMAATAIPDPKGRAVVSKITAMVSKLGPVAGKINFLKSTASYTTFKDGAWYTRLVSNYVAPEERPGAREPAPAKPKLNGF